MGNDGTQMELSLKAVLTCVTCRRRRNGDRIQVKKVAFAKTSSPKGHGLISKQCNNALHEGKSHQSRFYGPVIETSS